MAVWSYQPQEILTETWMTAVRVNEVSPRAEVMGSDVKQIVTQWRLHHTIVTTAEARSMAQFFQDQLGGWLAFQWRNPNDGQLNNVRFDSGMSLELFQPGLLRTGEIVFTAVVNS